MQEIKEVRFDSELDVSMHAWICVEFSGELVHCLMGLMVYIRLECLEWKDQSVLKIVFLLSLGFDGRR